jgi:uncharacterized protein YndB with AHSA1/START domain
MTVAIQTIEDLTLHVRKEIHVRASVESTFEALLEEIGPQNLNGEGAPMPMKLEAWPGGRWYRDLGDNNGHFWGNVQAIKRPTLLEISGPLFASTPCISNVQYRLSEKDGGTLITFHHAGFGYLEPQHREGVHRGWGLILDRIVKNAQARSTQSAARRNSH